MTLVLWDVLSVATYTMLRFYIGAEHAWPVVAVLCSICALKRDLEIHELVSVVYMLRYACRTDSIAGTAAWCACIAVGMASAFAHTDTYAALDYVIRRASLFCTAVLSIMLRYAWNTDPLESVFRLTVYTLYTRYLVSTLKYDPWDAAVQCIWLLSVPIYAYSILLMPFAQNAYASLTRAKWGYGGPIGAVDIV